MPCILCKGERNLTEEHVFPAFCGGVLVVRNGSCLVCNRDKCSDFEDELAANTRTLRNILEIANRYGEVPTSGVAFQFDGFSIPARRDGDGEIVLHNFVATIPLEDGKKQRRGFFIEPEDADRFTENARKRGERVDDVPLGTSLTITPVSQQTLEFAFSKAARQLAAKTALAALAYEYGVDYAVQPEFDQLRNSIFGPFEGLPVRIFGNEAFARNELRTPRQHSVITHLSAGMHKGWSIVTLFGGLSYIVELTDQFQERHSRSFSLHYNTESKRVYTPIVLQDEYNLIGRVLTDETTFETQEGVDEQWYKIIETDCKARGMDISRIKPEPLTANI